jgi:hypothetical protein
MPDEPVPIRVSEIGEFIRFQSCERRFKLGLDNRRLGRSVPFSERLFNTLDLVLQEVGREAERVSSLIPFSTKLAILGEDQSPEALSLFAPALSTRFIIIP